MARTFKWNNEVFKGTPIFDPQENAKEVVPVNVDAELTVAEFQVQLMPCEKPEGHGSQVYRRQMMVVGNYKVHVSGLRDYGIPNGFYLVREEFARKLLRYPAKKAASTGLMFRGSVPSLADYFEKNDHIPIDVPPFREPDSCPGL